MREKELLAKREAHAKFVQEESLKFTDEERLNFLKDIEPPWSWIHQFASQNSREKSYNFLEQMSIASDETPSESSDESFDFEHGQFISARKAQLPQEPTETEETPSELDVAEILLNDSVERLSEINFRNLKKIVNISELMDTVLRDVHEAELQEKLSIKNTSSILSFLDDKQAAEQNIIEPNIEQDTEQISEVNTFTQSIRDIIAMSEKKNIIFQDLQELHKYLASELKINETDTEEAENSSSTLKEGEVEKVEESMNLVIGESVSNTVQTPVEVETQEPQLTDKILECEIEIDEKVASKEIPKEMILGLVTPSVKSITPIPTPIITPASTLTPHDTHSNKRSSDVSERIIDFTDSVSIASSAIEMPKIPAPFICTILPMRGIGRSLSKQTIQNFLSFLKVRSREEKGMVYPRFFKETKCPNMVDCFEG